MRKLMLVILAVPFYLSCSKSNSSSPVNASSPVPTVIDTLNSWVESRILSTHSNNIWFTDGNSGLVAGITQLYSSSDGGKTWAAIPNSGNTQMFDLQFLDNLHGFAQGQSQLEITADGGKTWTAKPFLTSGVIYFQFVSQSTGFYNDFNLGIYKTVDTGNHWIRIFNGSAGENDLPFYFLDSLNGFILNGNGNFSKTVDGGANWQLVSSNVTQPVFNQFFKMQFLDTLNGYCATPNGLIKTTDGGKSWANSILAGAPGIILPYFFDVLNGYCLMDSHIYKTTNGGANWTVSCRLASDQFTGFHFLDMNTGWACSYNGNILSLKP